jgi:hypothetical protein
MKWIQGTIGDHSTAASIDTVPIISGVVHPASAPLWQGLPITEYLPSASQSAVGNAVMLATSIAGISGFVVPNDAMLRVPGSPVPQAWPAVPNAAGPPCVSFVRLRSGVRLVVAASPELAATARNAPINTPVAWDVVNQWLVAATPDAVLPVQLVGVTRYGGTTIVAESDGSVCWETDTAAAVIVL